MINLPIYRAKKIDSDEYITFESFYKCEESLHDEKQYRAIIKIVKDNIDGWNGITHIPITQIIDSTTLGINFPDMLDSQGNKIFASLQEDGKGGDIMQDDEYFGIAKYKDCQFVVEYEDCIDNIDNGNFEVIGIQQ